MEGSAKRKLVLRKDDDTGKAYRFKILLPNGTSVELTLRDPPHPQMPLQDFLQLVEDAYNGAREHSQSMKRKKDINWIGAPLFLHDSTDAKIKNVIDFHNYKPHKCHILQLHDGRSEIAKSFENMWDLTPDIDLLLELPEEYSFETALADLIDNSLQAVWSNGGNSRKLIRVNVGKDKISIFDNGPGMDDTDDNSLVKWGKLGASLHRNSKLQAIGGKPPYLMPYFGMFGYGGPIASMHLGRRASVSSKTKHVKKVYMLHLEREALLNTCSEVKWKTDGGIRDPSKDEIKDCHGSFTMVEIFDPKVKDFDINRLQCHLKDIYFPYIQCDELSDRGKTITPIEFQVNSIDLTEIQGGEVAITNLHSCNGPEFQFQLRLSFSPGSDGIKTASSREIQVANARLRVVYFPFTKGKENIERILEKLTDDGCVIRENFLNFSRVSVRRLGRLLPDTRWTLLPFMDFRNKKGNRANILKRCSLRVKCFIETDAGFKPTQTKTDLAHHSPLTTALKNLGSKISDNQKDVAIEIFKDRKVLTPLQLEKEYAEWLLQMHGQYDEEADSGEDQAVIIVNPANKKELRISSDVIRVHKVLKRKEKLWKHGEKIKVQKGACAGCHKTTVFATIEYFLLEGFEGDAGGDSRIICRPMDIQDSNGCLLSVTDENASLEIRGSMSIPIGLIDSGKLVAVASIEWENRLNKKQQKSPVSIDLLGSDHFQDSEVDGLEGYMISKQLVAVESTEWDNRVNKKQKKSPGSIDLLGSDYYQDSEVDGLEGYMISKQVVAVESTEWDNRVNKKQQKSPASIDLLGSNHYKESVVDGIDSNCKTYERKVIVKPSLGAVKYSLQTGNRIDVRVGSPFPTLSIVGYDSQDRRVPFQSISDVTVKIKTANNLHFDVRGMKNTLTSDKLTLKIEDAMVTSNELDKIRPSYITSLFIESKSIPFVLSVPCRVYPGVLKLVELKPKITEDQLVPGYIFEEFMLEMFDTYGNHVPKGLEVTITLTGFRLLNHLGTVHKVNEEGRINLSGLLKLTAGYGQNVSICVTFENKTLIKQEFSTVRRILRIASGVPDFCAPGGHLENIDFEIVNPDGEVDRKIHHSDKDGQFHMLTIKSDFLNAEESVRYTFKHGRCTVPSIHIPVNDGTFSFEVSHSQYAELCLIVKVPVCKTPNKKFDLPPTPNKSIMFLQDDSALNQECNLMLSVVNNDNDDKKLGELIRLGEKIAKLEKRLNLYNEGKAEAEQEMLKLLEKVQHNQVGNMDSLFTKDEIVTRIKHVEHSASSVFCDLSTQEKKPFMEDIIGVVALLGTVPRPELSRMLAEYLGEDRMLGVICRSFDTATSLQSYIQNGEIDSEQALHAKAADLGRAISKRFLVICFEDLRPYTRYLQENDSQRKLALPNPRLPNGSTPPGFMGYAVNMVDLDINHLQTRTASGHGLRETVLFSLFKKLQVYNTKKSMEAARAFIEDGAVSLDGGIIRENGIHSLGYGDPFICFPCVNQKNPPPETRVIWTQIEELKSDLRRNEETIKVATKYREKYLKKFRKKENKYAKLIDRMVPKTESFGI